jgi:glycosyltransferase involved in cell wall biosynthesis
MLVSIVIPAYNEEKYLPKTLESLRDQAHPDFDYEIIVVDARSTDKTVEVAKKYGVRVLETEKKTPAFARQKGVEAARGEIIVCIDADTLAPKDYLINVVSEFKKDPRLVGLTGVIEGYGGKPWDRLAYKLACNLFVKSSFLLDKPGFQGQSFAFKKSAFLKIGGFKTELYTGEDFDLGYRMAKIGEVRFLPQVVGISSVRRMKKGNLIKSISRGLFSYLRLFWHLPLPKKEKEAFPAIR